MNLTLSQAKTMINGTLGYLAIIPTGAFILLSVIATIGGGTQWLFQSVQVPVIWLLVLTFIPLGKLQQWLKNVINAQQNRQKNGRD